MNNYAKMTEAMRRRLVSRYDKDGYIILSASHGDKTAEESDQRFAELKRMVKKNGYSFLSVFGGYAEKGGEAFLKLLYVVPVSANEERADFERFFIDMTDIADTYGQEFFLVCRGGESPRYYYLADGTYGPSVDSGTVCDVLRQYFFALKRRNTDRSGDAVKGNPQGFTPCELYLAAQPKTIFGAHGRRSDGEIVFYDREKTQILKENR